MTKEEYMKDKTEGFILPEEVELIESIFDADIAPREKKIEELEQEIKFQSEQFNRLIEDIKCCANPAARYDIFDLIDDWDINL